MDTSDSVEIWKGYEIAINGKIIGKIKDYNPLTSTITFKRYGWLRRIWRWLNS